MTWINRYFGIHAMVKNQEFSSSKDWRPYNSFDFIIDLGSSYEYHCRLQPTMIGKVNLKCFIKAIQIHILKLFDRFL